MQLSPRYGSDPLIEVDGSPSAIAVPVARQRRRLAQVLESFTPEQWASPSRCDGWSARDVIVHLHSTNAFWTYSIAAGLGGAPTRLLAGFDPVASPAQLVAASPPEVLDRFTTSTLELVDAIEALDEASWTVLAEAPPGHLRISAVAHHALWDSWIHERDILLPLGIEPAREADEITACLRYAAALGPAFAANAEASARGTLAVVASAPDIAFVVEIGERVDVRAGDSGDAAADLTLRGPAVDLLDALSMRRPFDPPVPEESAWLVRGVAEVFDQV
jgi:uncharacterized protein (TIGR03083 family)